MVSVSASRPSSSQTDRPPETLSLLALTTWLTECVRDVLTPTLNTRPECTRKNTPDMCLFVFTCRGQTRPNQTRPDQNQTATLLFSFFSSPTLHSLSCSYSTSHHSELESPILASISLLPSLTLHGLTLYSPQFHSSLTPASLPHPCPPPSPTLLRFSLPHSYFAHPST